MELFQRVKAIAVHLAGSQKALALALGFAGNKERTFQGYLSLDRQIHLWPLLPAILAIYPQVDRNWLYFDEAEMLKTRKELSADNLQGRHIGDLLNNVLNFAHVSNEDVSAHTGISPANLDDLLESHRKPTFEELEILYLKLGINPSYFFDGNEYWMWWPHDVLQRLFIALGRGGREPTDNLLVDIFGITWEEAREFLEERQKMVTEGQSRVLTEKLQVILKRKYSFNPAWLDNGDPPLAVRREDDSKETSLDKEELVILRAKVASLQEELLEVHRRKDQLHDKIDELQQGPHHDAVGSHQTGNNPATAVKYCKLWITKKKAHP